MKEQKMIEFTREKLKEFKELYKRANAASQEQFLFEGNVYLTSYAKYVIEYLEMKFK